MTKENHRHRVGLKVYIRQRGKYGIFHAEFFFEGQHRRKTLKTKNKKVAIERAMKIEVQLCGGEYQIERQPPTAATAGKQPTRLLDAKTEFKTWLETEGKRRKTIVKYIGILDRFIAFAKRQGIENTGDVKLKLIDDFRTERNQSLSPKSMHHEGSLLKLFFAWCAEREMVEKNPLASKKFSPPKPKKRAAPSIEQVNAILKATTELRRPQFAMLAFTGARSGEIRNLRVEDVDFEGGWIHIRSRPGAETKNGEDRKVPLHPRLRRMLERLKLGRGGWFFTAQPSRRYPQGGHHINVKRLNEDLQRVLKRLKLPAGRDDGFTVHSFRRFFRTTAVNAGVPERMVDLWLGHNDPHSMGSVYYDLSDEMSQEFIQKIAFNEEA